MFLSVNSPCWEYFALHGNNKMLISKVIRKGRLPYQLSVGFKITNFKNLPNYAKSCKTTLRRDFHVFNWEACKSFKFCLNVHWSESVLYYKKPWVLFWLHNSCRSGRNKLSFHNTALISPPHPLLPRAALSFTVFIVSMYNKVSI